MRTMLFYFLLCSMMILPSMSTMSGTCPPCPAPPVHACCKPGAQVAGTCCQAGELCCFPVDDDLPPYCSQKNTCESSKEEDHRPQESSTAHQPGNKFQPPRHLACSRHEQEGQGRGDRSLTWWTCWGVSSWSTARSRTAWFSW